MAELANSIELILKDHNELPLILIGDFNLDAANRANKVFCDTMTTKYDCNQYVIQPTTDNGTTIDLIFSNYPHQNTFTIDCYWSDHNLLCTVVDKLQSENNTA